MRATGAFSFTSAKPARANIVSRMAKSLTTRLELLFGARLGRPPQGVHTGRGRVVLLGEHLDHQGGQSLAVPLTEGVACAWSVRPDTRVAVWAINAKAKDHFTQGEWIRRGRRWSDMARGACKAVSERLDRRLPGVDLMVLGDLPTQQGLASSAAFLVSLMRCLHELAGATPDPRRMAQDVAAVERDFGGVACGLMDPFVAAVGEPGQVLHMDGATLAYDTYALPDACTLDHVDSGVARTLSQTPYNKRREELLRALRAVHARDNTVRRLPHLSTDAWETHAAHVPEPARSRAHHVVYEMARVRRGVAALNDGDGQTLGQLMNACHDSLTTHFQNSTPQIDEQVAALQAEPDVLGARLQGAGWGGHIAVLRR